MCPHVIWDKHENIFKMWYSGGEQYEPDAIGYATSKDGLHWTKWDKNPIFKADPAQSWEQHKVTACQVIERENDYLMFYIGFYDINFAQIGMAPKTESMIGKDTPKTRSFLLRKVGGMPVPLTSHLPFKRKTAGCFGTMGGMNIWNRLVWLFMTIMT